MMKFSLVMPRVPGWLLPAAHRGCATMGWPASFVHPLSERLPQHLPPPCQMRTSRACLPFFQSTVALHFFHVTSFKSLPIPPGAPLYPRVFLFLYLYHLSLHLAADWAGRRLHTIARRAHQTQLQCGDPWHLPCLLILTPCDTPFQMPNTTGGVSAV